MHRKSVTKAEVVMFNFSNKCAVAFLKQAASVKTSNGKRINKEDEHEQ